MRAVAIRSPCEAAARDAAMRYHRGNGRLEAGRARDEENGVTREEIRLTSLVSCGG